MRYQTSIEINRPLPEVSSLFHDISNMSKWQEGLQSYKQLSGTPGQPGAKMELEYLMGKRKMQLVETIVANEPPSKFDAIYEAKGVRNMNYNRFEAVGPNTTRWTLDTDFQFSGFMKLFGLFFPGMFKKQTSKMMQDFKRFAESASV